MRARTISTRVALAAITSVLPVAAASADTVTINFEGLAESTAVSSQYADLGVTFGLTDSEALPVIATAGNDVFTAFRVQSQGLDSFDGPAVSGVNSLTDPIKNGHPRFGSDLFIAFESPVSDVSVYVLDIDGPDVITVTGFFSNEPVASVTYAADDLGTGDGLATLYSLGEHSVDYVLIDFPDIGGWAIDDLSFTTSRSVPAPGAAALLVAASLVPFRRRREHRSR